MVSLPQYTVQARKIESNGVGLRVRSSNELYELSAVGVVLTVLYAVAIRFNVRRFVWFDELFTFDIARAPSLHQLLTLTLKFDANPPLGYLLSRLSISALGQNALALRLPSILEFYLGSAALFLYVREKVGNGFAIAGVLMLWASTTFRYATEARPYALMFMFFAFLVLSWDFARREGRSNAALWAVAGFNLGMLLAHVFAPFSLLPILIAESVRSVRRRKLDYPLWAALLLPTLAMISYVPLFLAYRAILFPPAFQASFRRLVNIAHSTTDPIGRVVAVVICVGGVMVVIGSALFREKTMIAPRRSGSRLYLEDYALLAGTLLSPVLLTVILMHRHQALWDRYLITSQVAIYTSLAIFLGSQFHRNRAIAYTAALVLCASVISHQIKPKLHSSLKKNASVLESVMPGLPLVDASYLTFFEMNHYESPQLISRLYFLRDRASAAQYAHATMFEDFEPPDAMRPYFPIPARSEAYSEFLHQHTRFLVLGTEGYPEDWLLPRLHADGATISLVGTYRDLPYKDSTLFLVTLPNHP